MSYLDTPYWQASDADAEHIDAVFVALRETVDKNTIARVLKASADECTSVAVSFRKVVE